MSLAAFGVAKQRINVFESRLENLHSLQTDKLLQLRQELSFQAEIMLKMLSSDEQFLKPLQSLANDNTNSDITASHPIYRQIQLSLKEHLQRLAPNAVTHLNIHFPGEPVVQISALKPGYSVVYNNQLQSDLPRVQTAFRTGLSLEADGLVLKSVLPLIHNNRLLASLELGLNLKQVAGLRQAWQSSENIPNLFLQSAILVDTRTLDTFYNTLSVEWFRSERWSTLHPNQMLHTWIDRGLVGLADGKPEHFLVQHADKHYLLSILPWRLWDQKDNAAEISVSVQWQDVTALHNDYIQEQKIGAIILALSTIFLVLLGLITISFLQRVAKHDVLLQQTLLEQSEKKFAALFRLSPLPILLNRFRDGAYIEANPAMEQLVGYTLEELKQLSYRDLTPESYADLELLQLKALTETGRYGPYIKQYRHKNGELIDIELNGLLFSNAQDEKFIWTIIKDIREIKRIEKLKDDFVSTVSHELRTPLTSISGSLGLVLGGAGGALSPKAEKLLGIAHKNGQRLNLLINDLLDIEKLMAGKMRFDETAVALPRLLQDALEQHQPFALQHNVTLILNAVPDVRLWIDTARIQQVLANFLSNAVKFSPPQSEVVLGAEVHEYKVKIWVRDQGVGIAEADQVQLFKRFSQLNHKDNQAKVGTGLGLAISREIALQSGGNVGVNSTFGEGATFWLELPLYQASIQPERHETILVVEDDADTASVLCEFLQSQHYATDWAPDSVTAWQRLAEQRYDAITLDLKLREESGADFFLRLRDNPATVNMPVLIISAFVEQGKLQLAALANALDWLEKPVTPELLSLKIGQLLSQLPGEKRYKRILHVEDDSDIVTIMRLQLENQCEYLAVTSLAQANKILQQQRFDLILLDLGLPDGNGMSLLSIITQSQGDIPVVIFSAQDLSVENKQKVRAVFSKSRINTEILAKYLKNLLN
ncbi:hypothetical protein GCM10027181_20130 [Rheinheimera gaetbuli]